MAHKLFLGRRRHEDPRDHDFPMRAFLAQSVEPLPAKKVWTISSVHLDQGPTGTCVGHGWRNFLRCSPIRTTAEHPSAWDIYKKAILLDPWKDNDYEAQYPDGDSRLESGTTVRAGAQAVVEFHKMQGYSWAFDLATTSQWLRSKGPVVIGVNWYDSMYEPDAQGVIRIRPGARVSGGHCVCLRGDDMNKGMARGIQSWGKWGPLLGDFFIPHEDLERLIHEGGDVCTAIQTA